MVNELYQARLDDDLAERVDEYGEEEGLSKSDTIRSLLRLGLDHVEEQPDPPDDDLREAEREEDREEDPEEEGEGDMVVRAGMNVGPVGALGTILSVSVLGYLLMAGLLDVALAGIAAFLGAAVGGRFP